MTARKWLQTAMLAWAVALSACGGKDPDVAKQEFLKSGDAYFSAGKYQEAIVEYRNALQQDPRFGEARRDLAESYARIGDLRSAYREYMRAADLLPDDIATQLKAAGLMLAGEQYEDAKAKAQQILDKQPGNIEAQIISASALAGLKETDQAVEQLEAAVRAAPDDSRGHAALGAMRMMTGRNNEAESAFLKAVEADPKSIRAKLALANYYWSTGRTAETETQLKSALEIQPTDLLINRWLASFYFTAGRMKEAEPYFKTTAEHSTDPAGRLLLADFYRATKRWDDAEAALATLATKYPGMTADVALGRASIAMARQNPAAALPLAESVLKGQPSRVEALLIKADALKAMGDLKQAATVARSATEAAPDSANAQLALGRIEGERRERRASIDALQAALRIDARFAAAEVALGEMYLDVGKLKEAEQSALSAFKHSSRGDALLLLARVHVRQNKLSEAERELRALEERRPDSLAVQTEIARLRMARNDVAGARTALDKVLAKDPGYVEALDAMTNLDFRAQRLAPARARLEAAARRDGASPRVLTMLARVDMAAKDVAGAEAALQKAIALDASHAEAYALLGQLYQAQGKPDLALKQFELLAAREPTLAGPQTLIGTLLQSQNKRAEAKEAYRRALAIDATAAIPANNLAMLYAQDNERLDEALQLAQTARTHMPESPEVADTLGWLYFLNGQLGSSILTLKQAAAQRPEDASLQYHLGLAYAKNSDFKEARPTLERALKLDPASTHAKDAQAELSRMAVLGS